MAKGKIMILIFGSMAKLAFFGEPETRQCTKCGQPREFKMAIKYTWAHLYYIFGFASKSDEYWLACTVCKHGWRIEAEKAKPFIQKNPIPFLYRWGLLIGISVLVLWGWVSSLLN